MNDEGGKETRSDRSQDSSLTIIRLRLIEYNFSQQKIFADEKIFFEESLSSYAFVMSLIINEQRYTIKKRKIIKFEYNER